VEKIIRDLNQFESVGRKSPGGLTRLSRLKLHSITSAFTSFQENLCIQKKINHLELFSCFFSLQHNSEFGKIYYYQINLNWKITLAEQRTESRTKRHFLLFFVVVTKRIQKFLFLTQCCSLFRMFCFPSVCLCPLCNDVKTEKALFDYCLL